MAVDAVQWCLDQLDPVLELDPTINLAIPRQVEAQTAVLGWSGTTLTDAQQTYVGMKSLKAFVTRLLLKFAQEAQKAKGGKGEVDFAKAQDFLKLLMQQLADDLEAAASHISGTDTPADDDPEVYRWPGVGVMPW